MERAERQAILQGLPKVDLHRHLEGAIRLSTLLELGRLRGLDLPLDNLESLAPHVTWAEGQPRSLAHFLTKFRADWYRSYRDVERIVSEVVEDAASEGVAHLELRFSPEHLARESGLDPLGSAEAVCESGNAAAADLGLGIRYLVTLVRERYDYETWRRFVDHAVALNDRGVVGVDLAGDEFHHPNDGFERILGRAKDTGVLGVTVHAGEGTPAEQVVSAVEVLQADRLGHGVTSLQDPETVALLRERRIVLEMCPISNYQTGCVDDLERHPLPELDRAQVRVTLNSDDPAIHCCALIDEYDVAVTRWAYGLDDLLRLERNAVEAAFLDAADKRALLARVERGYERSRGQGL